MLHHESKRAPARAALILAGMLLAAGLPDVLCAAEKKPDSSLELIPADAAYYGAMLRNREQLDAIARSKAWQRITQLPTYQMAMAFLKQQYDDPEGKLAPLREWVQREENRDLLEMLRDAVSEEIFCYGAGNWVGFADLYTQLNRAQQFGQVMQMLKDSKDDKAVGMAAPRAMLRVLARNPDKVKVPDLVLGFKIKNAKKAEAQLKRLEAVLDILVMMQPLLEGRVKRVKIGEGNFLTLKLHGEMVPWDEVPWKDLEESAGEFDGVVKSLKSLKLTIALGVRGDFLLLSIGSATDGLKHLGGEGPRLTSLPTLKPLVRASSKRLTGISYSSKALRSKGELSREDVDSLAVVAGQALDAAGVAADKRKAIEKDLAGLAEELKKNLPSVGDALGFSFLSDRGYESFEYEHGLFPELDGTRPLPLLNHLGGDPILAAVGRSKGALESYQTASKWIKIAFGHAEPILLDKLGTDEAARKKYEQVRDAFLPLVRQLDETTSKMLLPALADGQIGFVFDAKWKSKQWHPAMPASDKELAMPELGILVGVSDAPLLEKAMTAYRKIIEDGLAKAKEIAPPGEVPVVKLPRPEVKTAAAGKLFVFRLPQDWKVDARVAPTAGLSEKVGVITLSAEHAERLLTDRPLKVEGGPLANLKRPLAGAFYFNWPSFVESLTPWLLFGLEQAKVERVLPGGGDEKKAREDIFKQVRTVLGLLKCLRVSTSATYLEEGVLVTHSETIVRDE